MLKVVFQESRTKGSLFKYWLKTCEIRHEALCVFVGKPLTINQWDVLPFFLIQKNKTITLLFKQNGNVMAELLLLY